MWLKCTKCKPGFDENENQKDRILIAKYYPSSNWYFFLQSKVATEIMSGDTPKEIMEAIKANTQDMDDRVNEIDAFFDKHRHGDDDDIDYMWGGENFTLLFDA